MHLDANGLPVQADGDAEDQLCRIGWILATRPKGLLQPYWQALRVGGLLTDGFTKFKRHANGDSRNVSGDQLVAVFCAAKVVGWRLLQRRLTLGMLIRLGFAQNYRRLNQNTLKIPDLLLHRVLPIVARFARLPRPLLELIDALLLLPMTIISLLSFRGPDSVDDTNHVVTLIACGNETFVAKLCILLYDKYRAPNYGTTILGYKSSVEGAVAWYNRAESGGNPEIGFDIIDAWRWHVSSALFPIQRSRLLNLLLGRLLTPKPERWS